MGITRARDSFEEDENLKPPEQPLPKRLRFVDSSGGDTSEGGTSEDEGDEDEGDTSEGDEDEEESELKNNSKQGMVATNEECAKNNTTAIVNEEEDEEEEDSSESEIEGDGEASNGRGGDMGLGEKLTNHNNEQTMVEDEEEEDDLVDGSESTDDSKASDGLENFDLEREEEQGKSGGVQSRVTIEGKEESKSQESFSEPDSGGNKESSSSGNIDNDDKQKQIDMENGEEDDDVSESESDTEASSEQENLDLLKKGKSSMVALRQPMVGTAKYFIASSKLLTTNTQSPIQILKKDGESNPYGRWSDDDVIVLLEGLIKVKEDEAVKPKDYNRFLHHLVRDSLHFKPSMGQIKEKVRRLKIMFTRAARESHEDLSPEGARILELCEMVWGKEAKSEIIEQSQKKLFIRDLRVDPCSKARKLLSEGFDLIKGFKRRRDFEGDWMQLWLQEIELYQEKLAVMKKHLDQVTDELHASLRSLNRAE